MHFLCRVILILLTCGRLGDDGIRYTEGQEPAIPGIDALSVEIEPSEPFLNAVQLKQYDPVPLRACVMRIRGVCVCVSVD